MCRELEGEETGENTIKAERTGRIQRETELRTGLCRGGEGEMGTDAGEVDGNRQGSSLQVPMAVFIGAVVKGPDLLK